MHHCGTIRGGLGLRIWLVMLAIAMNLSAQSEKIRIIAFGAHPDDCDIRASGTAALWAREGAAVKFVSVTNGDAGHQTMRGQALAQRRLGEAKESARRLGIQYDVLNNHDGELLPTLAVREQVIREIRQWNADVVLAPRPNDYHPDHRYTGVLVQDAAYMVVVPSVTPDTPALGKNPVFCITKIISSGQTLFDPTLRSTSILRSTRRSMRWTRMYLNSTNGSRGWTGSSQRFRQKKRNESPG